MARILAPVLVVLVGCSPAPTARQPFPDAQITELNVEQFGRSCAVCHAPGLGGAPRPGDAEAWLPRLTATDDQLLQHTVDGVGGMPPLGMCYDCSAGDLTALIHLLTEGIAGP